jgi:hypothetical protein
MSPQVTLAGWTALALAGIALTGFAVFELTKLRSHQKPADGIQTRSRSTQQRLQQSPSLAATGTSPKADSGKFLQFVERYEKAIVAISTIFIALFTVVLAIATYFLWHATRDLVQGAALTSERQLRAYVSVTNAAVINFGKPESLQADILYKNTGQTPAYKLTVWATIAVAKYPLGEFPAPAMTLGITSLGPSAEYHVRPRTKRALTPEEQSAVVDGTKAIYIYGEIGYLDAFDVKRVTRFRGEYVGTGTAPPAGGELLFTQTPEGNESN